jgi:stage II sporulation protein D
VAVLLAAGIAWAGAAGAEPQVRVLVLETPGPVRVGAAQQRPITVAPIPGGLLAGARPAGNVWRLDGELLELDGRRLRGGLEVRRVPGGLQVVNSVPLEHYVAGTLGREVHPGWEAEMLKAQAVATRSYALYRAAASRDAAFHLEGDTSGQVYGGADAETPAVVAAASATRGEYLAWGGEPILAAFHSASGGRTASAEEVWGRPVPYLLSVPVDHEEDSPDTYWRVTLPGTKLGRALAPLGTDVGPVRELRVVERSASGRARSVQVRGRDGARQIEARALRRALGADVIRSTLFETRSNGDGIVIVGSGHGHGVGMSQWGAQAMAKAGAGYREILGAFYPGAELVRGNGR